MENILKDKDLWGFLRFSVIYFWKVGARPLWRGLCGARNGRQYVHKVSTEQACSRHCCLSLAFPCLYHVLESITGCISGSGVDQKVIPRSLQLRSGVWGLKRPLVAELWTGVLGPRGQSYSSKHAQVFLKNKLRYHILFKWSLLGFSDRQIMFYMVLRITGIYHVILSEWFVTSTGSH